MKRTERIETVEGLLKSIKESLEVWEDVESDGNIISIGNTITIADSRTSILNRCMIARSELLKIMNELKGV